MPSWWPALPSLKLCIQLNSLLAGLHNIHACCNTASPSPPTPASALYLPPTPCVLLSIQFIALKQALHHPRQCPTHIHKHLLTIHAQDCGNSTTITAAMKCACLVDSFANTTTSTCRSASLAARFM